ncbi:methyl-accepting chemotaxis sensory transducer [Hirschia baltica ATCC 49814]|uniref:Methyl-accepting chemotaxis sensory transducer n=2 Tax=Hirschia TaxID=2723 RepID=C6XM14_HIRBI|nr:methyl-accepting chemotaxis sensory transducer [Hirschia baltica ATCC 49814]
MLLEMEMGNSLEGREGVSTSAFSRILLGTVESSNKILRETSVDVEHQAGQLSDLFNKLTLATEGQAERLSSLVSQVSKVDHEGQEVDLATIPVFLKQSLEEVSNRVLVLSKQGVGLIYSLDQILKEMSELNGCIRDIEGINRQTRLLSLNAQIEAARAGDVASGFQVVSMEMLKVSEGIDRLATRMLTSTQSVTSSIQEVISSIKDEYQELSRIGALDFSVQIDAKKSLEILMDALVNRNSDIQSVLGDSTEEAQAIANDIRQVVMTMQFQDRMKQRTDAIVDVMEHLSRFVENNPDGMNSEAECNDLAQTIIDGITLTEVRTQFQRTFFGESEEVEEIDDGIELF